MKDNNCDNPDTAGAGPANPYAVLLHMLTGVAITKPRCRPAANLWRKDHRDEIETEVHLRAAARGTDPKVLAPLREATIKELFSAIPKEEQTDWVRWAKEEHEEALAQWKEEVSSPPSTQPKDRQR